MQREGPNNTPDLDIAVAPEGLITMTLAPVAYALIGSVLAAFIFFYPIWTAMPQSSADQQMRIWVDVG